VKIACDRELSEVFLWDLARFAKPYGIKPQCVQIQSFDESLQAVSNGSVSAGVLGIPQMSTVASKNLPLKVIAGYTNGGQNIVIKNGVNVSSWSDFEGKSICVPQGTGSAIMVDIALLQQHVPISKVTIKPIGFVTTTALQALSGGQCDALAYWSPVTDQAVSQNIGHYSKAIDLNRATTIGAANGVLLANSKLYGNKTLLSHFLKAYLASMSYYGAHPSQWASVGAQLTGTGVSLLTAALPHQQATYHVDVKAAQAAAAYAPKFGYGNTGIASKIPGLVDLSGLASITGQSTSTLEQAPAVAPGV
jgi:ABC-type nitrate/sulfonate/bicarbonate transport system substrate-binding protein